MVRYAILLLLLLQASNSYLYAQELTSNFNSDNEKLLLQRIKNYELTERDYFISNIKKGSFPDIDTILLSLDTEQGILKYSDEGNNQLRIGKIGRGPFEYINPSIVYYDTKDDNIFVWDASQLKLIQYDSQGKGIKEFTDFRWSWGDFVINDSTLFFYNNGKSSGKYIQEYHLESSEIIKKFGHIDQQHAFFKIYEGSGGLAQKSNYIYYVSPSKLKVNRINTDDYTEYSKTIHDPDFEVPHIKNAAEIISRGKQKISELMRDASIVLDVYALENYLVLMAQVGKQFYNPKAGFYTMEKKKIKFYVLDYGSLDLVDTFTFSLAINKKLQHEFWSANKNHLIYISQYPIDNDVNSVLKNPNTYKVHYFAIKDVNGTN
ncbi:MAG: 6-bladed beta-propeller [Balneolaceae bacterium]|nr:6-bladed beta-propeller [Balneolaceae bacterium]